MQVSEELKKKKLESISILPKSYEYLVKGVLSQNFDKYWNKSNLKNSIIEDASLEEAYSFLESNNQLNTISRHIHLTESIETLSGIYISEKNRLFRGFLLNLEKTSLLLYFFNRISQIFNLENLKEYTSNGIQKNEKTFFKIWGETFARTMIRPTNLQQGIEYVSLPDTLNVLLNQQKNVDKIRKNVNSSKILSKEFKYYSHLPKSDIISSGISGPLARTVNFITPLKNLTVGLNKSSAAFYQYATADVPNYKNILEICSIELKLAFERMIKILPKISGDIPFLEGEIRNGSISSSFPNSFGTNHLSIQMKENRVKYLNFIPFEIGNSLGISKLISINPQNLTQFILLFLNPEISISFKPK